MSQAGTIKEAQKDIDRKVREYSDRRQQWSDEDREIASVRKMEDRERRKHRDREAEKLEEAIEEARRHLRNLERQSEQARSEEARSSRERKRKNSKEKEHARAQPKTKSVAGMSYGEYVVLWQEEDREILSKYYEEYAKATDAFMKDNSKEFPKIKTECKDRTKDSSGCVVAEKLGICHHQLEFTLRGCGHFTERWNKAQMVQWHPDKWVGKGELVGKVQEMFQLHQAILERGRKN